MQPWETAEPMEAGLFVPWMPKVPQGQSSCKNRLPKPPPQSAALPVIRNTPRGVGVSRAPTAQG